MANRDSRNKSDREDVGGAQPGPEPRPVVDPEQVRLEKIEAIAREVFVADIAAHIRNERSRSAFEAAAEAIKVAIVFVDVADRDLAALAERAKPAAADVESDA